MKLKELMDKLAKAQHDMGAVLDEAGDSLDFSKVKSVSGTDTEKAAAFRKMNDDCATIQKEIEAAQANESAERRQALAVAAATIAKALTSRLAACNGGKCTLAAAPASVARELSPAASTK